MKNIVLLLSLLMVPSTICLAQNELKMLEDSIHNYEDKVEDLKTKLNYGEDKLTASNGEGITCEVIKAYYDGNLYLDVEVLLLSEKGNPKLIFSKDNGFTTTNFCLLAEKCLKVYSYNISLSEINLKLEEGIKKKLTVRFLIHNQFKGPKPRLIEYLKLTEKQKNQEFIFRNIPIDYDEDK